MHFKTRNVNTAFKTLVQGIYDGTIPTNTVPSRAGEVLQIEEPVIISYENPWERVLLNDARDANPFFHLYESLWMLAGRNDVAPLDYYSSNYGRITSDDGQTANGAYGYRWRESSRRNDDDEYGTVDQLTILIDHLKRNSESRRAVLQMWNVESDLLQVDSSLDVCCNLACTFQVEDGKYLNMTVFNRSNDLIWGALGANACHFSFLQEYMAARIGLTGFNSLDGSALGIGWYHQISTNMHAYTERWEPLKWLASQGSYKLGWQHVPLMEDNGSEWQRFDRECREFVERHQRDSLAGDYHEPFLRDVAQPMCIAFHYHKRRQYGDAIAVVRSVAADDWRVAGEAWIRKRQLNWEKKNGLQEQ